MYKRLSLVFSLAVLLVVALSFASAVAAQESPSEETTMMAAEADNTRVEVKTDNVTVQRENGKVSAQTSNVSTSNETSSQQSSQTVQQNQADDGSGSEANTGDVNIAQNSSSSCKNPTELESIDDATTDDSLQFDPTGNRFRVTYTVRFDPRRTSDEFRIEIKETDGSVVRNILEENDTSEDIILSAAAGSYDLDARVVNGDATYSVSVDDCRGSDNNNNNNNNNRNNNNRNNDNNRNTRIIRINDDNDGGAANRQYGNEVIVKTIPDKGRLADTGGSPLILLAGAALLSTGLLVGRSVFRRDP